MVNNSKDSKFNDDSSQSYDSDVTWNLSRPLSSKNEEDDCSEAESDIQHNTLQSRNREASLLVDGNK